MWSYGRGQHVDARRVGERECRREPFGLAPPLVVQLRRAGWRQAARQHLIAAEQQLGSRAGRTVRSETAAAAGKGPTNHPKPRVAGRFGSGLRELAAYGRDRRIESCLYDDDARRALGEFEGKLRQENLASTRERVEVPKA
jgi:hypothetical protein